MKEYFTAKEVASGIFHIYEPAGVCTTLIIGRDKALIIDSGYGMKDLKAYVETLTTLPITLVNTHCHLDHAGGNYLWGEAFAHPFEIELYKRFGQPDEKIGLLKVRETPEDLNLEKYLPYKEIAFKPLDNHHIFDLGDRQVEAIYLPGHTKGSVLFYDYTTKTLISGDEIGDSLWIMFEGISAPIDDFKKGLEEIQAAYPISRVLYSHLPGVLPPKIVDYILAAINHLNPDTDSIFTHPRRHYKAIRHKEFVNDIPGIRMVYLVYPLDYAKSL